ncbi:macrophage mannose receptor 1-like protein [Dinothrombium tinctorium]|uniref:Macrophage mannose receptor 1-like protein n=1 Tax=Dinothrombium tinctorium TaxID=1965070 RepID=A0A443R9M7_9ACAR|nr:macrophage mannose receptor 1-like protein [Dinothrombium tinctorium]RWS11969.1 macrophage mannose receptor 1-like protein [Dinothrombium tinctorium]
MVTIKSEDENKFVSSLCAAGKEYWLGAQHIPNRSEAYIWSDGNFVNYTKWSFGQPNEEENYCVAIVIDSGFWWDRLCHENAAQLCQRSLVQKPEFFTESPLRVMTIGKK